MAGVRKATDQLIAHLFPEGGGKLFAVLDGASVPDLLDHLYGEEPPEFECLQRGELEPDMAEVAPYLALLARDSKFADWVIREGWGKHWGIFVVAETNLKTMRNHFRNLLTNYDADGKPRLFRYYDPRVLREYLPACDPGQLEKMFGPAQSFIAEAEDPNIAIRFVRDGSALSQKRLSLT